MILRLALRSLATRPIRTAVLACGFGFGIAVMAALLGVGDVILEQAHSPALEGGGDVVVTGRGGGSLTGAAGSVSRAWAVARLIVVDEAGETGSYSRREEVRKAVDRFARNLDESS